MKHDKKQFEYGSVSLGVRMELVYNQHKIRSGQEILVEVRKTADLDINPKWMRFEDSHTGIFSKLLNFQNGANKILRQARKLLAEGTYIDLSVSTHAYEDVQEHMEYNRFGEVRSTLSTLFFNLWTYKGDGTDTDTSKDGGLYLTPDSRYTDERHDIWIDWGTDILKALNKAGI